VKFEKSAKNQKFAKGLVRGFVICVVLGNLATKDRFLIFWIEKKMLFRPEY